MPTNPKAGQLASASDLVNVPKLITAYFAEHPDPFIREQRVSFGTSGHRGSALRCSFNEDHIVAISQAICEYRQQQNVSGPLFIGKDTHALAECGLVSALEVLAANDVEVMVDAARRLHTHPGGFPRHPELQSTPNPRRWRMALSSRPRTILLTMAASSTIPRMAGRQTPALTKWIEQRAAVAGEPPART